MGLSCGNPLALASLKEGDVVLDLGSGGGFDVFQAGPRVGKSGRVIGVDMTAEMLHKARNACVWYREHSGLDNVEFRLGEIEHLPVADNSVDVVLSNCVINLSPDKPQVWKEIFRVLRSGGKVSVSDIVLLEELPENVMDSVAALVGCISGAILLEETKNILKECGFIHISLDKKSGYIEARNRATILCTRKSVNRFPRKRRIPRCYDQRHRFRAKTIACLKLYDAPSVSFSSNRHRDG